MRFEVQAPHRHAEMGYRLLKVFAPFSTAAGMVRFHHVRWDGGDGAVFNGERVPFGSHLLHLADRVSVLRDRSEYILNQSEGIRERIGKESGGMFKPELVEAFMRASEKPSFWLNAASPRPELARPRDGAAPVLSLDSCELLSLTRLFAHIIDFRSKYTATHSAGVAAVAKTLADRAGFSVRDCRMMEIAGYLHDLGKLAVPTEILENPAKLTKEEYNVIFSHPFHTRRALQRIRGLDTVNIWASNHHERLNGRGYPGRLQPKELPLGSRIVAVADVFTATLEDRPYQRNLGVETSLGIIGRMAASSELDPEIARLLRDDPAGMDSIRAAAQAKAAREYGEFYLHGDLGTDGKCSAPARAGAAR